MFQQTCAFFFCLSVLTLLVCLSCFCRMNLHFVFSVFHILKEILMLYFLLHVSLKLTLCLSEWVYTRVNDTFLLFECYEILVALKKPGRQVGLHVSCDRHCSFFCSSESCSFSPLPRSPLSLLIHGLSAVLKSIEYKRKRARWQNYIFLFWLAILFFCFSLKMRPQCLFCLCYSSSLSCEVMWLVPSAMMFLFSESGIITLWQQLWLKEVLYVFFSLTFVSIFFMNIP